MKASKIPREQNPYFLTGRGKKKRWSFGLKSGEAFEQLEREQQPSCRPQESVHVCTEEVG